MCIKLAVLWTFQCLICPMKIGTSECFAINSVLKNVFKKFNNVSWDSESSCLDCTYSFKDTADFLDPLLLIPRHQLLLMSSPSPRKPLVLPLCETTSQFPENGFISTLLKAPRDKVLLASALGLPTYLGTPESEEECF